MSATTRVSKVEFTTRNAEMCFPGEQWQEAFRIFLEEAGRGRPIGLENSRSFFRMQTDQGEMEFYFHPGDPQLHMVMSPLSRQRE